MLTNNTNTHLTITIDKNKWIFTGTYDYCNSCQTQELVPVICYGDPSKDNWQFKCQSHLLEIACKNNFVIVVIKIH